MAEVGGDEALKPNKAELLKKLELGLIPDEEIKRLIRTHLERRLQWIYKPSGEQRQAELLNFVQPLRQMSSVMDTNAISTADAYDMPISFMKLIHGRALKLSWCYFEDESVTLDDTEIAMLDLYCERAQIKDGDRILDLGCGYGALTIHIARKYPNCHVTGITDTTSQKEFIEEQCKNYNLVNMEIILADITKCEMDKVFDRVMVISLIEHMNNYELLLKKISEWMKQDGLLFIDHICHKTFAYQFKPLTEDDWIEEYMFPGMTVTIPSAHLLLYFQSDVSIVNHWILNGKHMSLSNEEWLKRLDANADAAKAIMEAFTGSEEEAIKWINNLRIGFLKGIEEGKYNNGEEWMQANYLFKKK